MTAPAARIGKFAPGRKKPAEPKNSERQPPNAKFHVASEMDKPPPVVKRNKRKLPMMTGLINRVAV